MGRLDPVSRARALVLAVRQRLVDEGYHYPNEEIGDLAEALRLLGHKGRLAQDPGASQPKESGND